MTGKAGKNVVQRAHRVGEGHSVEVTVVPNAHGGVAAFGIDTMSLPVPDRKLTCDVVGLVQDTFMMKLLFAQKEANGDGYLSLLTVQMAFESVANFLESMAPLEAGVVELEKGNFPSGSVSEIKGHAQQSAAVSASIILAGYAGIEGCMDFYYASPFSVHSISLGNRLSVEPVVRVSLPAPLLFALSRALRGRSPLPSLK